MPSFKLVGRLKASEQIIAEEFKWKSWKVWLCLACEAFSVSFLAVPGFIHFGLYLGVVGFMVILAWQRAGLLTSPWCHPKYDVQRLKRLSLNLMFPEDYSAFGLAQNQRPARAFVGITFLLRLLCILSLTYVALFFTNSILSAPAGEAGPVQEDSNKLLGDYERSTLLEGIINAVASAYMLFILLSGPFWLIMTRCLCAASAVSGAAGADTALQERVSSRAKEMYTQMTHHKMQPSLKERALLYVDMGLFFLDLGTDANCAVQYFEAHLYVFFGLQVLIILVALLSEVSLLMMKEDCCCSGLWKAVKESITYGYPTDTYLAMSLREKSVEAPLSLLLQSYISVWLMASHTGGHEAARRLQVENLSTQVTKLSNFLSLALSIMGTTKAVYLNYHLDLAYHLDLLEGDRKKPLKGLTSVATPQIQAPASPPTMPNDPKFAPARWAPIQVGMPHGQMDTE